jgi:glycosyltransferase involved in cell wall biosynthesis
LEADVKCLVSHTETFGLALVEAALLGVPVVYTGGQAIDGYRNDGIWGYAADSRNPASIARAIKNCLELSAEDIRTAARVEFGAATYIQRLGEIYGVSAHSGKSNG